MRLTRPPYPAVSGTATFYFIHAGHRETAIDHAITAIADDAEHFKAAGTGDSIEAVLANPIGSWVLESLIQGAWMREYHEWEKATKAYFESQHQRRGSPPPDWKAKVVGIAGAASHVDRVRAQLAKFEASVPPEAIDGIDAQRRLINGAKHKDDYLATEEDYRALSNAVASFWSALASQEKWSG